MNIIEQVKIMYEEELYSNVVNLAGLLLTISEHNEEYISDSCKVQLLVYYGDSLYHLKEYRKAESIYNKALQLKKFLLKNKGKAQTNCTLILPSDTSIKYQIYLCNFNLKQYNQAIGILETIPGKQRTARINMALAKCYHYRGLERSAITGYKEVLRECPLALEAALGLLALGVKGAEVASYMLNGTTNSPNMEWLSTWIKAHAHLHAREFSFASSAFRQLDERSCLRDNVNVLVALGESYFNSGEFKKSIAVLQRAHAIDPYCLQGMDILASMLAKESRVKELESLATSLIGISELAAEPWVAMAYLVFVTKTGSKALCYAQKACIVNPRNVEAHILKGNFLLEHKKMDEALVHYKEALSIAPYRFEAHQGVANCYIGLHRVKDAITFVARTCKLLGHNPRTLTLYACVLAKDSLSVDKAESLLEKALKQDPNNLDAVSQLAELYEQEQQFEKGIDLLVRQVRVQSSCRLHQMLAELYRKNNEHEKALQHYGASLSIDRMNPRAIEGIQRLEQHPDSLMSTFDVLVDDPPESDVEINPDESEVEAAWSDMDFS